MLLHEIFSLFESLDILLTEGFKDDMYRQYPEAKDNDEFNNAINVFNSNENKIKDAVKQEIKAAGIEINGNIASAIKNKCSDAASFITLIKTLSEKLKKEKTESIKKQKELEQSKSHQLKLKANDEYRQIMAGKLDVSPTDYWMIPCHTFNEAHEAAFKYTGNLPRLSNEEIESKYNVAVPREATHYKTSDSPAEFLEKMKKETRFFMAPSWCVTANKNYFDMYKLETSEDETPLCYVFISKKYPNVRFCITISKEDKKVKKCFYKEGKIKITNTLKKVEVGEVRDSWQIGGGKKIETGLEMMKLAFGSSEVDEIIKNISFSRKPKAKIILFSELENGGNFFYRVHKVPSISGSFDRLTDGYNMFSYSDFETIDCKFPVLKNGSWMFYSCKRLTSFNTDFPSLEAADSMFYNCESLSEFTGKLPNLTDVTYMFSGSGIKTFKSELPKLNCGNNMFTKCKNLEVFDTPLPMLKQGRSMFSHCGELKFRTPLPNLVDGESMFHNSQLDVEGVKIITESLKDIKELKSKKRPKIDLGNIPENEEVKHYIKIAENKGWTVTYNFV